MSAKEDALSPLHSRVSVISVQLSDGNMDGRLVAEQGDPIISCVSTKGSEAIQGLAMVLVAML